MMHRGWLDTALCRNSRPSSYPFREPKHKAFHLACIIREPFSRIMQASVLGALAVNDSGLRLTSPALKGCVPGYPITSY